MNMISNGNSKRARKELHIIESAEKVFSSVGFGNTKMEDIAKLAGVSKGTIYFYFDTKENLYMALIYRAIQMLNDRLYRTIDQNKSNVGLEGVLGCLETYMSFSESHPFYSEILLDYMQINRSSNNGIDKTKLSNALLESLYYRKIQDIQNIPFTLIIKEIKRGVEDGSIRNKNSAEQLYLSAWATAIGFNKLNLVAGTNRNTIHHVNIQKWKEFQLDLFRHILSNDI